MKVVGRWCGDLAGSVRISHTRAFIIACPVQVLLEFKEYAQEVDVDFVRKV